MSVRYDGRCSLNNSRRIGETYTEGLTNLCGRAPCATSLWLYEQKQVEFSKQELLSQKTCFDGTLYIDGKWVNKNKDLLKEGFTPETDNTMEQTFSLIGDIINITR